MRTAFTDRVGIEVPLIGGAMYPCSNPELVAAVSEAGGIGVIQPIALAYVHGRDLAEGIKKIRGLTKKPVGFNAIVEASSSAYLDRMRKWIDIALENDVKFFVTALGNPRFVVERVHAAGGVVFHDVTERKWAQKALDAGVDGLICVNARAGGHAGTREPEALYAELADLGVPLVCAGGVGDEASFVAALKMGYAAVQVGTRFIATTECKVHDDYKAAIVAAQPSDIVLTERISGVNVAVIANDYVKRTGTKAGPIARRMLRHPRFKHWVRSWYSLRSVWQLGRSSQRASGYDAYWQAGKSVGGIERVEPVVDIVRRFAAASDASIL